MHAIDPWAVAGLALTTAPALIFAVWFLSLRYWGPERAARVVIVLLMVVFIGGLIELARAFFV